jgi:RHS repeat-associated protein
VNGAYYQYDAEGRRISKTVAGVTTQYIYDGWQVVQEPRNDGVTKFFTYGNYIDEPVCMVTTTGTSSDTIYYLQGNNYNVAALTDETGRVMEHYGIEPYGTFAVFMGKGADGVWFTGDDVESVSGSGAGNQNALQGRSFDMESGNYYFRNRYHMPVLGRFLSTDPAGYVDGLSLYLFAGNAASSYVDPYGYKKCCVQDFKIRKTAEENTIYYVNITVSIDADFRESDECCIECCWYEQKVRGRIRQVVGGVFRESEKKLYNEVPLNRYKTHEDGKGRIRYGHRGEDAAFTETGYRGSDSPQFALEEKGTRLDAFYYYESRIRDSCDDDQEVEMIAWGMKAWGHPFREKTGEYHLVTWGLSN